jgi:two-component system sensor histidine kinase DctS
MGTVLSMAATIIFFDFDQKGMTLLPPENIKSFHFFVFLQASGLFIFKITSNLAEMNNRYRAYLQKHSKLENQTRMSDLGRLTAGIAHEINNPLTVIRGSSSYCLKRLRNNQLDNQRLKSELTKVTKHVDRIVKIVEGLRFVSRDASHDPFESFKVNEVIKEAYELCRYKLTSEGVTSTFVPLCTPSTCNMRIVQIEQVIFTLISNAIDAFGEQQEKNISIVLSEGNKDIFIRIRDNGPGIPANIRNEVLKPFFTTKPVGKGTGLGLSIASEIIKKHNGDLTVEDSLEGASFLIRLPKLIQNEDQQAKAA